MCGTPQPSSAARSLPLKGLDGARKPGSGISGVFGGEREAAGRGASVSDLVLTGRGGRAGPEAGRGPLSRSGPPVTHKPWGQKPTILPAHTRTSVPLHGPSCPHAAHPAPQQLVGRDAQGPPVDWVRVPGASVHVRLEDFGGCQDKTKRARCRLQWTVTALEGTRGKSPEFQEVQPGRPHHAADAPTTPPAPRPQPAPGQGASIAGKRDLPGRRRRRALDATVGQCSDGVGGHNPGTVLRTGRAKPAARREKLGLQEQQLDRHRCAPEPAPGQVPTAPPPRLPGALCARGLSQEQGSLGTGGT